MTEVTRTGLLAEEHEEVRARRQRFTDCLGEIATGGREPSAVAAAVGKRLTGIKASELPLAAQMIWIERVTRPLKADGTKPLTARAVGSIRSWPSTRVDDLASALAEIEKILIDAENDAHHEVIYAEISRAYS